MARRSSFSSRYNTRSHRQSRRGFLAALLGLVAVVAAGIAGWWTGWLAPALARVPGLGSVAATLPPGLGTPAGSTPTSSAGGPAATATPPPDKPLEVARRYFTAWEKGDYGLMYDQLTPEAQAQIDRKAFVERYQAIRDEAGITKVAVTIPGDLAETVEAVPFQAAIETKAGPVVEQNQLALSQTEGRWGVVWSTSLIFKNLTGERLVRFVPDQPVRGRILDRNGTVLAEQGEAPMVGVIPGQIKDEAAVVNGLSQALGMPPEAIKEKFAGAPADWYVPIKRLPWSTKEPELVTIQKIAEGVQVRMLPERIYPHGELVSHVVGYVTLVQAEDLDKGYQAGDRVGRTGIEHFAEKELAGQRGGAVTIIEKDGTLFATLAQKKAAPGADVHLTLDLEIQKTAFEALGDRRGAVVVLDPKDGGVVAMVSKPSFNSNGFVLGFSDEDWQKLNDEELRPLMNRVVGGIYPPGSIFKVVTMTAGMERLGMGPSHGFNCNGSFRLKGAPQVWLDWKLSGHGYINLVEGLTASCDIVFYTIGEELEKQIDQNALPEVTRSFGLGTATGLPELPEQEGNVPDDAWKQKVFNDVWATGDTINFSIGQGFLLVTPLQMATIYVGIANGGTMWQPFLVRRMVVPNGPELKVTQPKEVRKLPMHPETLAAVRAGLNAVPTRLGGTGYEAFKDYKGPPAAGKTGTAETGVKGVTHAWFASYCPQENAQLVSISLVEKGQDAAGEGSRAAAPIARALFERHLGPQPAPAEGEAKPEAKPQRGQ